MTDTVDPQKLLKDLLAQQEKLNAQIEVQLKASREAALNTARELCKTYEFTATDLKGYLKVTRAKRTAAAPATKSRARKK